MKKLFIFLNNEFVQGGIYFFLSAFLINLSNYIFNFLVGRGLGPDGYGEISSMFSYSNIALTPTVIFSAFVIKKIGAKTADQLVYALALETAFKKILKKMFFLFLVLFLLTPLLPKVTNLTFATTVVLVVTIFLGYIVSFYSGALQGLRYFLAFSAIGLIATLLKLLGGLSLFIGFGGLIPILFFFLLSSVFSLFATYFYLNSKFINKVKTVTTQAERSIISVLSNSQFQVIFLSTISLAILNNADVIFVRKYFSTYEAGIYASWSIFAKIITYAIGPLLSLSFIFFSAKSQSQKHSTTLRLSLIFLALVFLTSYIFYTYFPGNLIYIFFGKKFEATLPFLSYASIFGSFSAAFVFLNNYFLAKDSNLALVLPFFIPLYLTCLFLIEKNILNVIRLNIFFSLGIMLLYTSIYLKNKLWSYFKPT